MTTLNTSLNVPAKRHSSYKRVKRQLHLLLDPTDMWWGVATLTMVGYGDVYPVTGLGKTLTACISILVIGMFALPAGILASGFSQEFKKDQVAQCCPHCGKELHL